MLLTVSFLYYSNKRGNEDDQTAFLQGQIVELGNRLTIAEFSSNAIQMKYNTLVNNNHQLKQDYDKQSNSLVLVEKELKETRVRTVFIDIYSGL